MTIDELEIKTPYSDWEAFRNLASDRDYDVGVYYRYRAAMVLPTETESAMENGSYKQGVIIEPLSETRLLSLKEARQIATLRFTKKMVSDFPRGAKAVSLETGLNRTLTSKLMKTAYEHPELTVRTLADGTERYPAPDEGVRPFTVPLYILPAVADHVMGTSINDIFFGTTGSVLLPTAYSAIAGGLELLEEKELDELISQGRKLMAAEIAGYRKELEGTDSPDLSGYGQIRGANEILYERIRELAEENAFNHETKQILTHTAVDSGKYKTSLGVLSTEENRDAKENAYEPSVDMVMFFSLESGQAMDYFVRNDYINIAGGASANGHKKPYLDIYRRTPEGKKAVENEKHLRILSFCTALKGREKAEFNGAVWKKLMDKDFDPAT